MNALKSLPIVAILIVGMGAIVLAGLAIVAEFSEELREPTAANLTIQNPNATVNSSVRVGTSGLYPYLQTLTNCENLSSSKLPAANYTFEEGDATGGKIQLLDAAQNWNGQRLNCSITYLAATTSQGYADSLTAGIGVFATFMSVLVLSLVGVVIIRLFGLKKE